MTDDSLLGIWRQMALYETFNQLYLSTLKPLDWSTGDDSSAFLIFMEGKKTYGVPFKKCAEIQEVTWILIVFGQKALLVIAVAIKVTR